MYNRGKNGNQRYKEKQQADTNFFRDSCKNPYVMLARENFPNFSFQELSGPRASGDLFEDKMLKYHHYQEF